MQNLGGPNSPVLKHLFFLVLSIQQPLKLENRNFASTSHFGGPLSTLVRAGLALRTPLAFLPGSKRMNSFTLRAEAHTEYQRQQSD